MKKICFVTAAACAFAAAIIRIMALPSSLNVGCVDFAASNLTALLGLSGHVNQFKLMYATIFACGLLLPLLSGLVAALLFDIPRLFLRLRYPNRDDENVSQLMVDDTESDGPAEHVMDYVISYSLRMAQDKYAVEKPILNYFCRAILSHQLGENLHGVEIKSVKVWKQWKRTDLRVEAILACNEKVRKIAILIENKYLGDLREGQLHGNKQRFDEHYCDESWEKRYALITCISREDPKFEKNYGSAADYGYRVFNLRELLPERESLDDTESEIFNQFFLRDW